MSELHLTIVDGPNIVRRLFEARRRQGNETSGEDAAGAIESRVRRVSASHGLVAWDCPGDTWRNELLPRYKADRVETPEAFRTLERETHAELEARGLRVVSRDGYEADDIIASAVKTLAGHRIGLSVVSSDKDLLSLTQFDGVRVYHPWDHEFIDRDLFVDRWGFSPDRLTDYLALAGDTSDGIPGARGIGPKTATRLLSEFGGLDAIASQLEAIEGSVGRKLREDWQSVEVSHKVARLDMSLSLGLKLSDLRFV